MTSSFSLFRLVCLGLLGTFLMMPLSQCVLGDTGPCDTDKDCERYGPARLFCSRHWCVPKRLQQWAAKQDAQDAAPPEPSSDGSSPESPEHMPCPVSCKAGDTRPCYPMNQEGCDVASASCQGECQLGSQTCSPSGPNGCPSWKECLNARTPSAEVCDGQDNDCDGTTDNQCVACKDGDSRACYDFPTGCKEVSGNYKCNSPCAPGVQTCVQKQWSSCKKATGPTPEICADGTDNDCNGMNDDGCLITFAGKAANSGMNDGIGQQARFHLPRALAYHDQTLYVADTQNNVIRQIDLRSGEVTTLSLVLDAPQGLAVDKSGTLYIANTDNHTIVSAKPPGSLSPLAGQSKTKGAADGTASDARFSSPQGLVIDKDNNTLYVADTGNHTIRKITSLGKVSTLAGKAGSAGSTDHPNDPTQARFNAPQAIVLHNNSLYIADTGNDALRKIDLSSGQVSTLSPTPKRPQGLAIDAQGNLYVANTDAHILQRLTPSGQLSTITGILNSPGSIDGPVGTAKLNALQGLSLDTKGNLYIADTDNHIIRKIPLTQPQ